MLKKRNNLTNIRRNANKNKTKKNVEKIVNKKKSSNNVKNNVKNDVKKVVNKKSSNNVKKNVKRITKHKKRVKKKNSNKKTRKMVGGTRAGTMPYTGRLGRGPSPRQETEEEKMLKELEAPIIHRQRNLGQLPPVPQDIKGILDYINDLIITPMLNLGFNDQYRNHIVSNHNVREYFDTNHTEPIYYKKTLYALLATRDRIFNLDNQDSLINKILNLIRDLDDKPILIIDGENQFFKKGIQEEQTLKITIISQIFDKFKFLIIYKDYNTRIKINNEINNIDRGRNLTDINFFQVSSPLQYWNPDVHGPCIMPSTNGADDIIFLFAIAIYKYQYFLHQNEMLYVFPINLKLKVSEGRRAVRDIEAGLTDIPPMTTPLSIRESGQITNGIYAATEDKMSGNTPREFEGTTYTTHNSYI